MHIAFNGWFWDKPYTGSGQYVRRLVAALRKVAPELAMTVILPPHTHAADLPPNVNAVTTRGSSSNLGKVWFEQRTYPAAVGRLKADIAHVPYWGAPLTSPARLITSVLDMIPLAMPEYAPTLQAKLYTSLVSTSTRGSGSIITISNAAKADIVQYLHIPPDEITVTPLAVDDTFHPRMGAERDPEVRRKYDLPNDYVLYLGGFDVRKQVQMALAAYRYVTNSEGDNYPFVMAGKYPDWNDPLFPNLPAYAKDIGVDDFVRWIGAVDDADKPSVYRMARVFIFPTIYEGFCLPILEALACGTPVIAQDIPVINELVGDAAYLVRKDDVRSMGGALLALLGQESLRDTQISRGLGRATQFSWRKTARETLTVYEKVMAK